MKARHLISYLTAAGAGAMAAFLTDGPFPQPSIVALPPESVTEPVLNNPDLIRSLALQTDSHFLYTTLCAEFSLMRGEARSAVLERAKSANTPAAEFILQLAALYEQKEDAATPTASKARDWATAISHDPDQAARDMCSVLETGDFGSRSGLLRYLHGGAAGAEVAAFLADHSEVIRASGMADDLLGTICDGLRSDGIEEIKKAADQCSNPAHKNTLLRAWFIAAVRETPSRSPELMDSCDSDHDRLLILERWLLSPTPPVGSELESALGKLTGATSRSKALKVVETVRMGTESNKSRSR